MGEVPMRYGQLNGVRTLSKVVPAPLWLRPTRCWRPAGWRATIAAGEVVTIAAASFAAGSALMPWILSRLRAQGFVVRDMYKPQKRYVVTHAGILSLAISAVFLLVALVLRPPRLTLSLSRLEAEDPIIVAQLMLFTVCGYGVIGVIDDRHSLTHLLKALAPWPLAFPIVPIAISHSLVVPFAALLLSLRLPPDVVYWAIVPLYILIVTNLVNMHSGFNGLQSGLSLILLATVLSRAILDGRLDSNWALFVVAATIAAFYPMNRFPAKAIEGNVGSFLAGAAIGVGIVANGLLLAGVVMLLPHIVDFLLFAYARLTGRPFIKFGRIRSDGTIEAPYPFKLKFLLTYYFRLTERAAVRLLYLLTFVACLASFLVPTNASFP